MTQPTYHIIFSGLVLPGRDPIQVRERLGQMFKLGTVQLDLLFSGAQVPIKKNLDLDTATKYRTAFQQAGALVELRRSDLFADSAMDTPLNSGVQPHSSPSGPDSRNIQTGNPASSGSQEDELHLLPANTGSLIDCARPLIPATIPDTSWMDLAPLGSQLAEDKPPPPPLQVDLDAMRLTPPRTGSLEDCRPVPKYVPIPDISHLDILHTEPVTRTDAEF